MVGKAIRKFGGDENGAIAPLYALSLFGLVAMAGVGFDYARVMALDTELQSAADQLALAAATQLDQKDDSMVRARQAARNYFASSSSDYANITRLSNVDDDGDGDEDYITNISFRFWQDYNRQTDAPVTELTSDDDSDKAHIVEVRVNTRTVRYALTPIVGAIAGDAAGVAMATMDSAYCKVPPLMTCEPHPNFGAKADDGTIPDAGKGLALHFLSNGKTGFDSDTDTSGLFGFLDFPYPAPDGVGNQNTSLGWEVANPGCTGEDVLSEPGVRTPEEVALNTRFDFYDAGYVSSCNTATGTFCPSSNVQKDMVVEQSFQGVPTADVAGLTCDATPGNNASWVKDDDIPDTAVRDSNVVGYQRDNYHENGGSNVLGDTANDWNFQQYMSEVHGLAVTQGNTDSYPTGLAGPSRYDVYNWEKISGNEPPVRRIGHNITQTNNSGNSRGVIYCAYPSPVNSAGVEVPTVKKDRRVLSVASVDCTDLKGRSAVSIIRYIDVFLVEPTFDTGSRKEFYVEVIGESDLQGSSNFQNFAKKKAVLIR